MLLGPAEICGTHTSTMACSRSSVPSTFEKRHEHSREVRSPSLTWSGALPSRIAIVMWLGRLARWCRIRERGLRPASPSRSKVLEVQCKPGRDEPSSGGSLEVKGVRSATVVRGRSWPHDQRGIDGRGVFDRTPVECTNNAMLPCAGWVSHTKPRLRAFPHEPASRIQ